MIIDKLIIGIDVEIYISKGKKKLIKRAIKDIKIKPNIVAFE
tara:strand:+ start:54 stop:179 length:126 start_codon:yes stop_codon:yes gene_type:complete